MYDLRHFIYRGALVFGARVFLFVRKNPPAGCAAADDFGYFDGARIKNRQSGVVWRSRADFYHLGPDCRAV